MKLPDPDDYNYSIKVDGVSMILIMLLILSALVAVVGIVGWVIVEVLG